MTTTQPKVLVTSAAGKTGRQTALALLKHGLTVRAIVRIAPLGTHPR